MTDLAAIKATWATYKPVPTRNVLQLTLEVPLEQQEEVFRRLGYPVPGRETWVGVALMNVQKDPKKPRQSWESMSRAQQAGLMCSRLGFWEWLDVSGSDAAADYVRRYCGVESRAKLDTDQKAGAKWDALVSRYRQATGQMAEVRG